MDLYHVVLFVHVMGAIVLVGMGFSMPLLMNGMARAATVSGVRSWAGALQKLSKMGNPAAVLVLLSGLFMAWDQFSFADGWIIVALVLFFVLGGIAGGVLDPAIKKIVEAADAASDGPVPADLRALVTAPRAHTFEALMFGIDLAVVFLMTNKPGLVGALLVAAAGFAVGALRVALQARRHAAPAAA